MRDRIAGCDYCGQCGTGYRWLKLTPGHPERLFCDCQWAARLKHADGETLEALREDGDDVARRELLRRMQPRAAA